MNRTYWTCCDFRAGNLLSEVDSATGQTLAEYVWLDGAPLAYIEAGNIYQIHVDHLGTPQVLTDSTGQVAWEAHYAPFGRASVISQGPTFNLRFPGQYFDAETGLHYNWHRYYDPAIGRYITSDPIGLAGGLNTYGYVGGNPNNRIDPAGLAGLAGAAYGAAAGFIGGYISSESFTGAIAGGVAGAAVGLIVPANSGHVGSFTGNAIASLIGQSIGLAVSGNCFTNPDNYSIGAAVGAGIGGAAAGSAGKFLARYMDPIRKPVIGSLLGRNSISYSNRRVIEVSAEGVGVGMLEFYGGRYFPANSSEEKAGSVAK